MEISETIFLSLSSGEIAIFLVVVEVHHGLEKEIVFIFNLLNSGRQVQDQRLRNYYNIVPPHLTAGVEHSALVVRLWVAAKLGRVETPWLG